MLTNFLKISITNKNIRIHKYYGRRKKKKKKNVLSTNNYLGRYTSTTVHEQIEYFLIDKYNDL